VFSLGNGKQKIHLVAANSVWEVICKACLHSNHRHGTSPVWQCLYNQTDHCFGDIASWESHHLVLRKTHPATILPLVEKGRQDHDITSRGRGWGTNEYSGLHSTSPWSWQCRCVFVTHAVPRPFHAHLKGVVPYLSPVSVCILLRLTLVMVSIRYHIMHIAYFRAWYKAWSRSITYICAYLLRLTKCYHVHIFPQSSPMSIFLGSNNNSHLYSSSRMLHILQELWMGLSFMSMWLELTKIISSHQLNYTMSFFLLVFIAGLNLDLGIETYFTDGLNPWLLGKHAYGSLCFLPTFGSSLHS